jgi:hypothetical protein
MPWLALKTVDVITMELSMRLENVDFCFQRLKLYIVKNDFVKNSKDRQSLIDPDTVNEMRRLCDM